MPYRIESCIDRIASPAYSGDAVRGVSLSGRGKWTVPHQSFIRSNRSNVNGLNSLNVLNAIHEGLLEFILRRAYAAVR